MTCSFPSPAIRGANYILAALGDGARLRAAFTGCERLPPAPAGGAWEAERGELLAAIVARLRALDAERGGNAAELAVCVRLLAHLSGLGAAETRTLPVQ